MAKVVIPLKYPVPLIQGHLIEVEVQRIRVRDRLAMENAAELRGSDSEGMVALVASNTGVDATIVIDMDDADFANVVTAITDLSEVASPEPEGAEEKE